MLAVEGCESVLVIVRSAVQFPPYERMPDRKRIIVDDATKRPLSPRSGRYFPESWLFRGYTETGF
jgi:hypothetical protein